jgi:AcrR family transcriptional regulator
MGRHREFDVDEALDAALGVFWQKGYQGASYNDLTQATGVERPALYSAFGNKEALFLKALELYYTNYLDFFEAALALPTARDVVGHILHGTVELNTRYPQHTGCLGIHGALAASDDAAPIQRALIEARARGQAALRERLELAREEGDLPKDADCDALSAFVCAVSHGMAVQAKAGFSREALSAVADQALSSWPKGGGNAPVGRARKRS